MDGFEALHRIGNVGRERHGCHTDLVVRRCIARCTQAHGHRREQRFSGHVVVLFQVAAHCTGGGAQHHIVERATQGFADEFRLCHRDRAARKAALVRHRHIEQCARAKQLHAAGRTPVALAMLVFLRNDGIAQGAQHGGCGLEQLDNLVTGVAQCRTAQLGKTQLILMATHTLARRLDDAACGFQVEQRLRHGDAGLAVHARVMRLGIQRNLAAFKAINDEKLPQRAASVQQAGVQTRHVLLQLAVAARLGQGDVAHVVFDVNVLIFDPHRVGEVKRNQRQLAREQIGQVHALSHALFGGFIKIIAVEAFWQIHDAQRAHMHRHFRRFEVQKGGIKAA